MALRMVDDVLAPKPAIVYEYYGPNPFALYSGLSGILQSIFHVRGKDIFEDQFRWDITDDPRPFFFVVRMMKGMDKYTEANVQLKVYGKQPTDPKKDGALLVEIVGWIETNFFKPPYEGAMTALQKAFVEPVLWTYNQFFYYKIRRQYIHFLREGIEQIEAHIRNKLGLEMRERQTPYKTDMV